MFNFVKFLADIPGPFPYYDPDPAGDTNLLIYAVVGLVIIAGATALVLIFFKPKNKKDQDSLNDN